MLTNDLNVIALIGVLLLIGIVKKNAIMMIDFALEAERNENKSPEEAIYQACIMRFRPIMMTTMAALLGGVAAGVWDRHRFRTSPAARNHDRRRPDRQPDAHAIHHPGRLFVYGPYAPALPEIYGTIRCARASRTNLAQRARFA